MWLSPLLPPARRQMLREERVPVSVQAQYQHQLPASLSLCWCPPSMHHRYTSFPSPATGRTVFPLRSCKMHLERSQGVWQLRPAWLQCCR